MRDDSRTVPDPTLQFEFRILQVHKGHHAAVHEETDLLVEHDGRGVVRLVHTGQLQEEPGLGVHPDKVDVPLGKGGFHLVALVQAHETVVHEHAGELLAHGFRQQGGNDGGIHAAGEVDVRDVAAGLLLQLDRELEENTRQRGIVFIGQRVGRLIYSTGILFQESCQLTNSNIFSFLSTFEIGRVVFMNNDYPATF